MFRFRPFSVSCMLFVIFFAFAFADSALAQKRKFKEGQDCLFLQFGQWKPAIVTATEKDQVEYQYEFSGRTYTKVANRDELRFPWELRAITKVRTWKDESGKFSIQAAAVGLDTEKGEVVLHRIDNDEEITLSIASLAEPDRKLLSDIQVMIPDGNNPQSDEIAMAGSAALSEPDQYRTWSSSDGKFKVEAIILDVTDGTVKLKKRDGSEISVPVERLGPTDQKVIEEHIAFVPPPIPEVVEFVSGPRLELSPRQARAVLEKRQHDVRKSLAELNIPEKGVRERTKDELKRLESWGIDESVLELDLGNPFDVPDTLTAVANSVEPAALNIAAGGVPFRKIHLEETIAGVFPVGGETGDVVVGLHTPVFGIPSRVIRISMADQKFRCAHSLPHGEHLLDVEPATGRLVTVSLPTSKPLTPDEAVVAEAEDKKRRAEARAERLKLEKELYGISPKNLSAEESSARDKVLRSEISRLNDVEYTASGKPANHAFDHFLTVWESDPSKTKTHVLPVCRWNAKCTYISGNRESIDGKYAKFLSPTRLIYRYGGGEHIVWDIGERKEVGKFTQGFQDSFHAQWPPAVRNDNRVIAYLEDDALTCIDAFSFQEFCRLPIGSWAHSGQVQWSPDGTKLASYQRGDTMDLAVNVLSSTPNVESKRFDLAIGGIGGRVYRPKTLDWVDNRLILLDRSFLFDTESGLVVWEYMSDVGSTMEKFDSKIEQGKWFFFEESDDRTILVLGVVDLPGPGVRDTFASVEKTLEFKGHRVFVVESGTTVRVDVGCGQYDVEVREALEKKVAEMGWIVDPESNNYAVRATIAQSVPVSVTYEFEGKLPVGQPRTQTFSYAPWQYVLQIRNARTVYWEKAGGTGAAAKIRLLPGESAQKHVQESQQPSPSMLLSSSLPARVVQPEFQRGFGRFHIGAKGLR